ILNHFAFDYPAVQTKDSIVIEQNDAQDRPRLPDNESYYVLKLKACNPACGGSKDQSRHLHSASTVFSCGDRARHLGDCGETPDRIAWGQESLTNLTDK